MQVSGIDDGVKTLPPNMRLSGKLRISSLRGAFYRSNQHKERETMVEIASPDFIGIAMTWKSTS
jgi:hypothetical protein